MTDGHIPADWRPQLELLGHAIQLVHRAIRGNLSAMPAREAGFALRTLDDLEMSAIELREIVGTVLAVDVIDLDSLLAIEAIITKLRSDAARIDNLGIWVSAKRELIPGVKMLREAADNFDLELRGVGTALLSMDGPSDGAVERRPTVPRKQPTKKATNVRRTRADQGAVRRTSARKMAADTSARSIGKARKRKASPKVDYRIDADTAEPASDNERYLTITARDVDDGELLSLDQGFLTEHTYRLQIDLSADVDPRQEDDARPLRREDGEEFTFVVAVVPRTKHAMRFRNQVGELIWSPDGTKAASFVVDIEEAGLAVFDILVHRDLQLIFVAAVEAEIVVPGAAWERSTPLCWRDATASTGARSRAFRRFQRIQGKDDVVRSVCIAVQKSDDQDDYLMTVLVANAELPVRATFSRAELDANWLRLRGILDRLRRDPVMLDGGYDSEGKFDGDFSAGTRRRSPANSAISADRVKAAWDQYLRDLALAGVAVRSALFSDPERVLVQNTIQDNTPDGSVIQVWLERDALAFALPWNWLYDGSFDPTYRSDVADPSRFWGHRYVIEQVGDWLNPAIVDPPTAILGKASSLRVRAGTWAFAETRAHLAAARTALERSGRAVEFIEWTSDRDWEPFLPCCDADLLYFFAHGHTAMPASVGADAVRKFVADAVSSMKDAMKDDDLSADGRDALTALIKSFEELDGDVMSQDHYISLDRGYLKMEDLRTFAPRAGVSPLVVLNMCESAQVYPALTDGLTHAFLRNGAVGVLGTEVAMLPAFAAFFGIRLLQDLAAGVTIGEALLKLRREMMAKRNMLGFAYTYYGDVSAGIPIPMI